MAVRARNRWNPGIYEDQSALVRTKSVSFSNMAVLAWCPQRFFAFGDFLRDSPYWGAPHEGFRVIIGHFDEFRDCRLQFADVLETPSTYTFVGYLAEPTLNEIQPGRTGGSEMKVVSPVAFQPPVNLFVSVGAVGVDDYVYR